MKVYFFLLRNINSTTSYSDRLLANSLMKKGYDVDIVEDLDEKFKILKNPQADIIFFQKTIQCPAHTAKCISHLKGKVFLCHIDDDFHDMNSQEHIDTLKLTDLVLVGNEAHKAALKSYTTTAVETFNCLLDEKNHPYIPAENKNNNPLMIGWQQACADAYVRDLLSISNPLNKLHQKYNFTLNLSGWHMGIDYPDFSHYIRQAMPFANLITYVPMDKYFQNILPQLCQYDIFIFPYLNLPERIGKSGFALKRAMLMGMPVVTSNTNHNKTIIEDGVDGFLADNEAQWYQKLEKLIVDTKLRTSMSFKAYEKMKLFYNEDAVMDKFISSVQKHFPNFKSN